MSYLMNNQQKLNDIIFAGRNKNYGAYALRSDYGNTVLKSISIVTLGFGSIFLMAYYLSNRENEPNKNEAVGQLTPDTAVYVVKFKTPEPPEPENNTKKTSTNKAANPDVAKTSTVISDTVSIEKNKALNNEIKVVTTTTVGSEVGTGSLVAGVGGTFVGKPEGRIEDEVVPLFGVDKEPEFEGGLKALYKFLGSHLKYPPLAIEIGKEGTVHVKFVVDENGKVTRLTLLNNLGYGLDEEALRVVSMIPKFKSPAYVKGRPVKSYFQVPIKFTQR